MSRYLLDLRRVDRTHVAVVGGKGAHLGELSRVEGVAVPAGFCVTTEAFRRIMADAPSMHDLLDRLSRLDRDDLDSIGAISAQMRRALEEVVIPDDLATSITRSLARLGERAACAVRSSATAEDSRQASFAGQQDTYLNVVGPAAVLQHISRCWASLFTERAVSYRLRQGFDHRMVEMAVVVQKMVFPRAAGVLFTADPATSNRKVASVEATFGLGEALVSGRVNADIYRVRDDEVVDRAVASKERAVLAQPGGGTQEVPIEQARQKEPALTDAQVVQLARAGRRIEAHFGCPQDIEWCLVGDRFEFVQSRPITTLFPVPESDDNNNHVYLSVGHQQMMTDAMRPLGLSFWQMTTPADIALAGGRLFVDVTPRLASPTSRAGLLELIGRSDPLTRDALQTILDRDDVIRPLADPQAGPPGPLSGSPPAPLDADPAVVLELIERSQASIAAAERDIRTKHGVDLLDFIEADLQELKRVLFDPRSHQVFTTAMDATWWLNDRLNEWLGEKNAADTLTQSVPHNVTSEMGLALLDVADAIRPHPDVVELLRHVEAGGVHDDEFLDAVADLPGGWEARDAIQAFLNAYGMRCVGEIDITRPRWSERPTVLVPMILTHIDNVDPGEARRRFERGRQEAWRKEQDLLDRLRALPDGERKATETKRMIDRVRTFIGYREYPKYGMVSRYYVYKRALLDEADRLVGSGALRAREDIFFLTFQELRDVARTNRVDDGVIARRRDSFRSYQGLTPPRVLTSDGEAVAGSYRRDGLPTGALVGLPVSAGTVEGRARVVLDMADADLRPGDILVTACTDPSWSPLFVAATGLVTEVGALMTHGAVVAREYGLPAVVGVERATQLIQDGQRIRLNGTDGYVEIVSAT